MSEIKQYNIKVQDWRSALHRNNRNTINVIIIFIAIYIAVGLLLDVLLNYSENIPLNTTLTNLVTFKSIPLATFIMLIIAIISLLIAYYFHQGLMMLGTKYIEVTADSKDVSDRRLYNVIEELKIAAGLNFMPKVFIIDATYMNAFASGYSEKSAMVAITRGLMEKLDRDELQAVMAHELSHIRNNDIRLLLIVTILSNLILMAISLIFRWVVFGSEFSKNSKKESGNKFILILIITVARILLPIITVLLMLYLSRTREFMADAGCVELTRTNEPLARALLKIDADYKSNAKNYKDEFSNTENEEMRQASYLYDPKDAGILTFTSLNNLFSTHPPLEARLKALGVEMKKNNN